jgi:hypothetical protein
MGSVKLTDDELVILSDTLVVCPFCGAHPTIINIDDEEYNIMCLTEGCYLKYGNGINSHVDNIHKLIDKWNMRVRVRGLGI